MYPIESFLHEKNNTKTARLDLNLGVDVFFLIPGTEINKYADTIHKANHSLIFTRKLYRRICSQSMILFIPGYH